MRRLVRQWLVWVGRWGIGMIAAVGAATIAFAADPVPPALKLPSATQEAWRGSPFHGAINGATGKPIPCICRYREQEFRLGDKVCLQTPSGAVLVRCDLMQNNTSWVPTDESCTISWRPLLPAPQSFARKS